MMNRFIPGPILYLLAGAAVAVGQPLPGTSPLTAQGDLASEMVAGIDRYLTRELESLSDTRAGSRERLKEIIGAVDPRVPYESPELITTVDRSSLIAQTRGYEIHAVRWPVFPGVDAEGLMLRPRRAPLMRVVALPDADWTPEAVVGLTSAIPAASQYARRLAESGCLVLIPVLIDRADTWSGDPRFRFTNQPHREFIYRMAFQMGRHIIGYEVQKVLAAVDWFAKSTPKTPIGVVGYGEGGLLALHAAAIDERIDSTVVSGYGGLRGTVWQEPIYRNVWSLSREFSEAGIRGLIAPRKLIVEQARFAGIMGPPGERDGRRGAAPGSIPSIDSANGPGSDETLQRFLGRSLGPSEQVSQLASFDPAPRLRRQFDQLVEYTQGLVRRSESVRLKFLSKGDKSSPEAWNRSMDPYRRQLWEDVLGKLPDPTEPLRVETRRLYDYPTFVGYEVLIPAWRDVPAYGVLLVPKNLKAGERRPVVVTQHGLEGRPQDLVEPKDDRALIAYQRYAARLAERGFIVYAPQNPYIFGDRFRTLVRKANPLKLTLYSFIVGQHARTLDWLSALPFVDPERIGFYGLSYGGKTAMRAPALLNRYALAICSGDFNEWIWKTTRTDAGFSYAFTGEYEIYEFNLGHTFNYAEMAGLIAPRPFMVERGHHDGVSIDEWVAYEFAKVRRLYSALRLPGRTDIEFFNGPHSIYGNETFEFLHRHLRWP